MVTWGDVSYGGNSSSVAAKLSSNVIAVYSNYGAFAALKSDGSVVTWGYGSFGGNSNSVAASLSSNVSTVYSNGAAFAALKSDGSVVTWGSPDQGGNSSIANFGVYTSVAGSLTSNVTAVFSSYGAFAALKSDGSVVTWGDVLRGGDSSAVSANLTSNVTTVFSNSYAFAALKSDGSVVTWGDVSNGGNSSAVAASLSSNVTAVYSNIYAFAALKGDGSLVNWGNQSRGGSGAPTGTGFASLQSVSYYDLGVSVTASSGTVTSSTASLLGEVTKEGKTPVTARGFIYAVASTNSDPKIGESGVTQVADGGNGLGNFSKVLSGLSPNTAYVFKAYAIHENGTTYSPVATFSTNLPPVITSNGATGVATVNVAENSTSATTVSATDADADQTITYSITGGTDAARFAIDSSSGALTFVAAPDFEAPGDANADNVYQMIVSATDNGNTPKSVSQTLTITVTNLLDNGALVLEQADGTAVASGGFAQFGSLTLGQTADLTFTLRSVGEADLVLPHGFTIGGAFSSAFSVIGSLPSSLATGSSITFNVRFSPIAGGQHIADLSFATNDTRPDRSSYVLNLRGTGLTSATPATYATATTQVRGGWINGTNFTIGTVNTNWPSAESPDKAVDNNTGSKFLALRNNNAGLILSPTNATVAFNRLSLYTANDAPERDPASYVIYGSTTALTGTSGTNLPLAGLTQLASGTIILPDNRNTGPAVVQFANTTAYASYIVAFPTVRSTAGNSATQISEVQLSQGMNPPSAVAMTGARGGQLSSGTFTFGSIGNANPGTNWNANESPDQAIDGSVDTKYLLFRNTGAGLIASPQAGSARVNRLSFWTANDFPERDPLTYQVYGFSTAVTARSGTLNVATGGTLLGSGTLALSATRLDGPATVTFNNTTAYASYLVVFPTVNNSPSTTMTQISEVQFGYNGTPEFTMPNTVTTWGSTWSGQGVIPPGLRDIASISSGYGFQLALKKDGTVSAWGLNDKNQTAVPAGLTGVTSISASTRHSLARKNDGTVVAWGYDYDGTTVVPTGLSGVTSVAAGDVHNLALKNDGTVVAWGNNTYGEKNIPAGLSGVVAIAAGQQLSLALKSDGTVVAWGLNNQGQATVPAGLTGVIAIAAGDLHALALKSDGTVVAWGYNGAGQCSVPVGLGGVKMIAAGGYHSIALKNDGTVVAWGSNNSGQLNVPENLAKTSAVTTNGITCAAIVPLSLTVAEDSGDHVEQSFATGITPGIGDVGQTVSFTCSNDNNALFSAQPAISSNGTLTFTPAANAYGTATVNVIATDSTGLSSAAQTFNIEVTAVADPPVMDLPIVSGINPYSAKFSFDIVSLGDSEIQGSGFIYAPVSANATLEYYGQGATTLPSEGGDDVFVAYLLASGTSYNVRSYAYGPAGMVYSGVTTFTTSQGAAVLLDNTAALSSSPQGGGNGLSSSLGFGYKITTGSQAVKVSSISLGLNSTAAFCLRLRLYECGANSLPVGEPLSVFYDDSRPKFSNTAYATVPIYGWQLSANHSYVVMVDNTSGTATAIWNKFETNRQFDSSAGWTADAVLVKNDNGFSTLDAAGYGFAFQMTGTLVENPPALTALETWRQQHYGSKDGTGNGADLAAPDGDGISNLMKYALNITPGGSGAASLPRPAFIQQGGSRYLALSVTRDSARNDVTIEIEAGNDLTGWTVVGSSVNGAAFTGSGFVSETDANGGLKLAIIRDTVDSATSPKRFIRVKASN